MFRMFVLGAVTLSAWSIALERPTSEAQACHRRRCGGCYSGCGSGYSNYGYASNCNSGNYGYASYGNCGRSRCGYRGYNSCAPQYTTASNCSGYVNQCGYSTPTYTNGTIAPQAQPQTYGAEDVAPPPAPAPNSNTTTPQPAPAPPAPAPQP